MPTSSRRVLLFCVKRALVQSFGAMWASPPTIAAGGGGCHRVSRTPIHEQAR
ncbi:MAG: hypothetical protein LBM98_07990 [Oscillospiraceae bacterium]|nr:hypothetical protein [Oscillospiraceae bacterium]